MILPRVWLLIVLIIAASVGLVQADVMRNREGKAFAVVQANIPLSQAPEWALLERKLIDTMDKSAPLMVEKYVDQPGDYEWPSRRFGGTDGLDDAYESFHNYAIFYTIGGDQKALSIAEKEWEDITRLFAGFPTGFGYQMVEKEFCSGYDWMHIGESTMLFYSIGMADPTNPRFMERAKRFAGFYLNEDPDVQNYDANLKMIKCAHNGSHGPCYEHWTGRGAYAADTYGLPFWDIPDVRNAHDLRRVPGAQPKMGEAARSRNSHGDVAVNLAATSLVTNAYLLTGDAKYKSWVKEYVDAWRERTKDNGGIIPDNIGPSGKIGECIDGKWYGGNYGWTFPHGWETIGDALTIASENATLLSGDVSYMNLPRSHLDHLASLGVKKNGVLNVPHKHTDPELVPDYHPEDWKGIMRDDHGNVLDVNGWYEFMPIHPTVPTTLWWMTMDPADLARIDQMKDRNGYSYRDLGSSVWWKWYHKDLTGMQYAWVAYLRGRFPEFPERALKSNLEIAEKRYAQFLNDKHPKKTLDLLERNPILTEALLELTMGAPQPIYNGALLNARVRHFDWQARRPGMPRDIGVLVQKMTNDRVVIQIVNLSTQFPREMIVQAGSFGEHLFTNVRYETMIGGRPSTSRLKVDDKYLFVRIEPMSIVTIDAGMKRYVGEPSYALPWGITEPLRR